MATTLAWKGIEGGVEALVTSPFRFADRCLLGHRSHYPSTFIAYLYLSGAQWGIGYSQNVNNYNRQFNGGFGRLLTDLLNNKTLKIEVDHNLDVLQ